MLLRGARAPLCRAAPPAGKTARGGFCWEHARHYGGAARWLEKQFAGEHARHYGGFRAAPEKRTMGKFFWVTSRAIMATFRGGWKNGPGRKRAGWAGTLAAPFGAPLAITCSTLGVWRRGCEGAPRVPMWGFAGAVLAGGGVWCGLRGAGAAGGLCAAGGARLAGVSGWLAGLRDRRGGGGCWRRGAADSSKHAAALDSALWRLRGGRLALVGRGAARALLAVALWLIEAAGVSGRNARRFLR